MFFECRLLFQYNKLFSFQLDLFFFVFFAILYLLDLVQTYKSGFFFKYLLFLNDYAEGLTQVSSVYCYRL